MYTHCFTEAVRRGEMPLLGRYGCFEECPEVEICDS